MKYIHCLWIHKFADDPVVLVSEVNDNGFEIRKVEYWRSGQIGIADENTLESNVTQLGLYSIGSVNEINADEQFSAIEITKEEFENHWELATSNKKL